MCTKLEGLPCIQAICIWAISIGAISIWAIVTFGNQYLGNCTFGNQYSGNWTIGNQYFGNQCKLAMNTYQHYKQLEVFWQMVD